MIPFSFSWPVYTYQIERRYFGGLLTLPGDRARYEEDVIVRVGDTERRPRVNHLKAPGLLRQLAGTKKTAAGALGDVSRWGVLSDAEADYERVADLLPAIELAREIIAVGEKRNWQKMARALDAMALPGEPGTLRGSGGLGALGIQFVVEDERPSIRLRPADLLHAAIVQYLDEISR